MAPPLIQLTGISLTFGGTPLLQSADLSVSAGERVCLVGRNGSGKSTLLKVVAGLVEADGGSRFIQPGVSIRYLPQEPALDAGLTVADNIAPGVAPMRAMLADFDAVSAAMGEPGADLEALMGKMERLQSAIDAANGWELDRQVGDRDAGVQVCVLVFINPEP